LTWMNLGIVFGAIGIGFLEDLSGLNITIQLAGFLAVASGIFVLGVMKETKDKDFQIVFFKQN
jgi:predicted MFS family arabinose efflux permease